MQYCSTFCNLKLDKNTILVLVFWNFFIYIYIYHQILVCVHSIKLHKFHVVCIYFYWKLSIIIQSIFINNKKKKKLLMSIFKIITLELYMLIAL